MSPTDEPPVIRFGSYEADLRSRELRKQGIRLKLQEQPFRVLTMLLEHPGELVTREELRARLWPSDTFVDFDNALNTDINKLRDALGDSSANPRFVETVPRRGYRFVAPVDLGTRPEVPARWWRSGAVRLLGLAALLLITAAGTWLILGRTRSRTGPGGQTPSLAVLPLENLSQDPGQEYFADGLTDEMITAVAKVGSLRVISRTSVMQYKKTRKNVKEVGRELNVGLVVEGSVFHDADHVRINTALIEADTDTNLWSGQYDRDLRDVLALQNEVARDIAREVHLKLTPQEKAQLSSARPVNPAAYEAYVRGRYDVARMTRADLERGLAKLREAIALDPNFALPYDGIANYYLVADEFFLSPSESMPQAKEAVSRVLELDDGSPQPHNSLGMVHYWFEWDWQAAEKEFRRAIALSPNYALAHSYLGWTFATQRRFEEAYVEMKRAEELDPRSPETSSFLGWVLYFMGRYDDAARQLHKTIAMDPTFWPAHVYLGRVYEQQGKLAEALRECEEARRIAQPEGGNGTESSIPEIVGALARARALNGDKNGALGLLTQLGEIRKHRFVPAYPEAAVYAALGQNDRALERLEKAYQDRSFYITWLAIDPELNSLRSDSRFRELIRRVALPQ